MKIIKLFYAAVLCTTSAIAFASAPYQTDVSSFWFNDSSDSNGAEGLPMPGIVFYPSKNADGSAIAPGTTFPATLFMQGGNVDAYRYQWLRALAAWGYIVVIPDRYPVSAVKLNGNNGVNPNTKLTNVSIMDAALQELKNWTGNDRATENVGVLPGTLPALFNGDIAVAGHSLGGVMAITGVSVDACNGAGAAIVQCPPGYTMDPSIKAMWLIGGHNENPNGPPDTSIINKPPGFPIYMIAASEDGASTVKEVTDSYKRYRQPKIFYEQPGNHFGWTDYLHPEDDLRTDCPTSIEPQEQQAMSIFAIRKFLDCNLKNDWSACNEIPTSTLPASPPVNACP